MAIATLAQAVVLAVTMVILIFQSRSQEKAIKESAYQKVMDDYNDIVRIVVTRPELSVLLDDLIKRSPAPDWQFRELSNEERLIYGYLLMIYGFFERVYSLHERGWIDGRTWGEWENWLAFMAKHPIFARVHAASRGMFNESFQDYVSRLVQTPPPVAGEEPRTRA